ncbi:MAG: magnesium transporter [Hydrotalea sp.]|nr:magnesium transporter [Hydrotalea sp.]MDI9314481.1 magnesium transporter [Hydrotalea sp.]
MLSVKNQPSKNTTDKKQGDAPLSSIFSDEKKTTSNNPIEAIAQNSPQWKDLVKTIRRKLLGRQPVAAILPLIKPLSPPDMAELIHHLNNRQRLHFIDLMIDHINPEVFTHVDDSVLAKILPKLPTRVWQNLLKKLESDDALDLIEVFNEKQQQKLLSFIPRQDRAEYNFVLSLPDDTAGKLMRHELVTAPKFWTVGQMIDFLRDKKNKTPDLFHNIIIVGPSHRPIGILPVSHLLRANRPTPLAKLMIKDFQQIPVEMNQEDVARIFDRYGLVEAPVVDSFNRLVGTITVDDVMQVMEEEYEEDIMRLGGVQDGDFHKPIIHTTYFRFIWLFVNLLTAVAASMVINVFEATIEQLVALAVLMPIVPSMGGNAGTQTTTVVVRALATGDLVSTNTLKTLWKETAVGWLNGILFAFIVGGMAYAWKGSLLMAYAISGAIIITLVAAAVFGVLIPLALKFFKQDPAISSTVFLTWVTDTVGFMSFLLMAKLLMG